MTGCNAHVHTLDGVHAWAWSSRSSLAGHRTRRAPCGVLLATVNPKWEHTHLGHCFVRAHKHKKEEREREREREREGGREGDRERRHASRLLKCPSTILQNQSLLCWFAIRMLSIYAAPCISFLLWPIRIHILTVWLLSTCAAGPCAKVKPSQKCVPLADGSACVVRRAIPGVGRLVRCHHTI